MNLEDLEVHVSSVPSTLGHEWCPEELFPRRLGPSRTSTPGTFRNGEPSYDSSRQSASHSGVNEVRPDQGPAPASAASAHHSPVAPVGVDARSALRRARPRTSRGRAPPQMASRRAIMPTHCGEASPPRACCWAEPTVTPDRVLTACRTGTIPPYRSRSSPQLAACPPWCEHRASCKGSLGGTSPCAR